MEAAEAHVTRLKYHACVDGLRAYITSLGATDVVLGLSGGIDSSVVACMCADAFGADHVHGVMMPGPYSSSHSVLDAQHLAINLGIHSMRISINDAYDAFAQPLMEATDNFIGLASENTQARCRMVVLMALSNANNWMVVNTDNKSEAMMGYSTLYGDTAGVYAPMGGLYKVDVYRIAHWINQMAVDRGITPPIPENVLTKPPSAELAENQMDEDMFGSYTDLDRVLIEYVERGVSVEDLLLAGEDGSHVAFIVNRIKATEFKRKLLPPYPYISYVHPPMHDALCRDEGRRAQ